MRTSSHPPHGVWRRTCLLALALPFGVGGALRLATALPLNSVDAALTGLVLCGVVTVLAAGWTFGAASLLRFGAQALVPASLVTIMLLLLNGKS